MKPPVAAGNLPSFLASKLLAESACTFSLEKRKCGFVQGSFVRLSKGFRNRLRNWRNQVSEREELDEEEATGISNPRGALAPTSATGGSQPTMDRSEEEVAQMSSTSTLHPPKRPVVTKIFGQPNLSQMAQR